VRGYQRESERLRGHVGDRGRERGRERELGGGERQRSGSRVRRVCQRTLAHFSRPRNARCLSLSPYLSHSIALLSCPIPWLSRVRKCAAVLFPSPPILSQTPSLVHSATPPQPTPGLSSSHPSSTLAHSH
jgi:hypothetical protein